MDRPPPLHRRARAARLLAGALALALLVVACSEAGSSGPSGPGEQAVPRVESIAEDDPDDQGPDPLPDPGVAPGECRMVTYTPPTAADAYQGELCRPEGDQRDVAVMVVHGGSGIGGSYTGMRPWATRLLAEGYVVLLPAYHLFTPGEKGPVFPRPEQNIMAATQFLRGTANALGIRRNRIVVQGMSAGSRIGSVAYTHPDDPFFEGDELWPDIDRDVDGFIGFYHTYDGSMQYSGQYYGGADDSADPLVRARWDAADAMAAAAQAAGPALFITGDRDWNLIVEHQNRFAAALAAAGIDSRTVVVKGGSHGFDAGSSTRLSKLGEQAASEVLRWLNEEFPQRPPRPAESTPADLATAPNYTGGPPATFDQRRRTTPTVTAPGVGGTTIARSGTSSTSAPSTSSSTVPDSTSSTSSSMPTTSTTSEPTTTSSSPPPPPVE